MNAIFLCENKEYIARVYPPEFAGRYPVMSLGDVPEAGLPDVEAIYSTWGMPEMDEARIRALFPGLRWLFYGAGTVQYFVRPFLKSGVRVFSAWDMNAIPVAEFTAAQILLANKGYFQLVRRLREDGFSAAGAYGDTFPGNYGEDVGLLGAGMIGKRVIRLLSGYDLNIKVYDPFLSREAAEALKVEKMGLEEIFSTCRVVSNHLADKDEIAGILSASLFASMKKNAVFINTGRGRQVDMDGLVRAMAEEPGRTALLDVTYPEPLPPDHPAWKLPNILITPHRAGCGGKETLRMGICMIEETRLVEEGKPPRYEVTPDMLERMA